MFAVAEIEREHDVETRLKLKPHHIPKIAEHPTELPRMRELRVSLGELIAPQVRERLLRMC